MHARGRRRCRSGRKGAPLLDAKDIAAWIELHIEQGPVLAARDLPVGIVTGIRGNIRHRVVECIGTAGHSGAVPRWLRHDAMFATSELISHLDHHWRTLLERGRDLVITTGVVTTDPREHAIARIPGRLRFSFELRSQSKETLEAFYDLFLSECRLVGEERGVEFKLDRRLESAPAIMDPGWVGRLKAAARALGLPDEEIPSGAGHDAAVFANEGIPSAMIFVRNEHGSHNPDESMKSMILWRASPSCGGAAGGGCMMIDELFDGRKNGRRRGFHHDPPAGRLARPPARRRDAQGGAAVTPPRNSRAASSCPIWCRR
jgi:N-carbamoyl-L-amino-acid hydrolase